MVSNDQSESNEWISSAHRSDLERGTELGTLGYLPPEIRDKIWQHTLSKDSLGERVDLAYFHPPVSCDSIFSTLFFFPHRDKRSLGIRNLRLASTTMRNELDHVFLSTRTFHFPWPRAMTEFWNAMSIDKRSIRSISVDISPTQNNGRWLETFAFLPRGIRSLTFEVNIESSLRASNWSKNFEMNASSLAYLKKEAMKRAPDVVIGFICRNRFISPSELEEVKAAIEDLVKETEDESLRIRLQVDEETPPSPNRLKHTPQSVKLR